MDRYGKKCVLYSRVSTEMQVDGFSLAGQKTCLTKFVEREEMKIIAEYEDAGKSGKSIEGRPAFKRMLDDIKNGLEVEYIIVYKLSRFGRNAADVLNSLEFIQEYGVNLICTDEGIDSSQASGRLLISVLSAVAQIERENILEQSMNGRREKARQGLWNGGMAPYGYSLEKGKLVLNEEETKIVKIIFDTYANTSASISEIAKYCNNQNFPRSTYGNRVGDFWSKSSVGKILSNPVYIGKIEWGHRQNVKVKGSKEMKRIYTNENIIFSQGQHDRIIDDETWKIVQDKRKERYEYFNCGSNKNFVHLLSGLLICPVCGGTMCISESKKKTKAGVVTRRFYYTCRRSKGDLRKTCFKSKYYSAEACETLVRNAIAEIVKNEQFFADLTKEFTADNQQDAIKVELANYQKKLKSKNTNRAMLESDIDNLDINNPNYSKRREALNDRLNKIFDEIFEIEEKINDANAKLNAYKKDIISAEYIKNILCNFNEFFDEISIEDKKELLNALVSKIHLKPKEDSSFEIALDSIEFKFPIFKSVKNFDKTTCDNIIQMVSENSTNRITQIVKFGNQPGEIPLEPQEIIPKLTTIKAGDDFPSSDYISTQKSNDKIAKYVKDKYDLIVYGKLIRTVKCEVGIHYRTHSNLSFETSLMSIEKFDAITEAFKVLNIINEKDFEIYDLKVSNARQKLLDCLNKKTEKNATFKKIIDDIRLDYNLIITDNNIKLVLKVLDGNSVYDLKQLPSFEKCKLIYDKLLENKIIPENTPFSKIQEAFIEQETLISKTKRKKYTNDDVIEYVKRKYDLVVNASMISYVRDKLGICVKSKDRRFDPTQKNKRVPNQDRFNAIVEAMKFYRMT